ncbi:MAG: TolC family protein, partial [Phenylobacterium sp.]
MRSPTPAVAAAALVLAACATGHRSPQTPLPAAFEAPTPVADAIDLDRWWLAFGDPQLTELVDEALVRGWDVRIAAARLTEARAVRTSALTAFLPQGDLTGSGSKTHSELLEGTEINIPGVSTGGDSERYQANFDVSWEVDLWGRIFAARRATNADVDAARFAYEGARASLAAAVADAYFQARGLAIQL